MAQIDVNQFSLNNVSRTFKARHNEAAMQHLYGKIATSYKLR